jgi:hypothetical protein
MKRALRMILVLLVAHVSTVVQAATDKAYVEQASEIAEDLKMLLNAKKPILPQVLGMRDALRDQVFETTRMTSKHTFRCKRLRHQLMEVNSLVRNLRNTDE